MKPSERIQEILSTKEIKEIPGITAIVKTILSLLANCESIIEYLDEEYEKGKSTEIKPDRT
jgi:hypothetical protein